MRFFSYIKIIVTSRNLKSYSLIILSSSETRASGKLLKKNFNHRLNLCYCKFPILQRRFKTGEVGTGRFRVKGWKEQKRLPLSMKN